MHKSAVECISYTEKKIQIYFNSISFVSTVFVFYKRSASIQPRKSHLTIVTTAVHTYTTWIPHSQPRSAPKKLFAAQVVATMNASRTFKRLSAVPSAKLGVTKTQRCNPVSFRWPFCPPGGFTAKSTLQLEATKFKEKKVQFKTKHKNFFSRLFRSKKSLELVESSSDSEDVQQT